jgi:XTP/dITP diphosphohydrolase/tetrapyrrole methylase family protein/MazG family protein/ATP diphosphatase
VRVSATRFVAKPSYLEAFEHLDEVTRRLRRECPWDREQDARSIVPHTVEEAYELADAANRDDTEAMVDELGDVLFQVFFLSLLLEERREGDLAAVAESCAAKLIRRHPHVYGDRELETAGQVLSQWEEIKREVEGGGSEPSELPENLPALLYARKVLRRVDPEEDARGLRGGAEKPPVSGSDKPGGPGADPADRAEAEHLVGTLLIEAVAISRRLGVDPELALRQAARRLVD